MTREYDQHIFDVCDALHGDNCGSGEPLSPRDRADLRAWLQRRLANWAASKETTSTYDSGVLMLMVAALTECGERDARDGLTPA